MKTNAEVTSGNSKFVKKLPFKTTVKRLGISCSQFSQFRNPSVYLGFVVGITLCYFSFRLAKTIDQQENSIQSGLQDVDEFLNKTVSDLNKFIQLIPNQARKIALVSTDTFYKSLNLLSAQGSKAIASMNSPILAFQYTLNKIQPFKKVTLSTINLNSVYYFRNLNSTIPELDLSSITIPSIPFSAKKSCGPVASKVVGSFATIAWHFFGIGFLMIFTATLIVIEPLAPNILKRRKIALLSFRIVKTLMQPSVSIPLMIGILFIFIGISLTSILLEAKSDLRDPIVKADEEIGKLIDVLNLEFSKIPDILFSQINSISGRITEELEKSTNQLSEFLNSQVRDIQSSVIDKLNSILSSLGMSQYFDSQNIKINFTQILVVKPIPKINIDLILLKRDSISLQKTLLPISDKVFDIGLSLAYGMIMIGLGLLVIPIATVFGNSIIVVIPDSVKDLFKEETTELEFETIPKSKKKKATYSFEIEIEKIEEIVTVEKRTVIPSSTPSNTIPSSPAASKASPTKVMRPLPPKPQIPTISNKNSVGMNSLNGISAPSLSELSPTKNLSYSSKRVLPKSNIGNSSPISGDVKENVTQKISQPSFSIKTNSSPIREPQGNITSLSKSSLTKDIYLSNSPLPPPRLSPSKPLPPRPMEPPKRPKSKYLFSEGS